MAGKEEAAARGNDWEVVSLTASAYAASPGPRKVDEVTPCESHPLYMSGHFVFPHSDSEHQNIATEPNQSFEINEEDKASNKMEQETRKDDGDLNLKGLNLSDEFTAGLEFLEEKGKGEESIFKTAMSSLQDERAIGGSHVYEHNEPIHEQTEPDEKHEVANVLPCQAWWKRSAASLISQAKETNTVWSIFIAAAVMGIVMLGQHWQQERWQIMQLKWESSIGNEKAKRLMGPISRLKQAFVGGQRRDSFIRVTSQNDS